MPLSAAALRSRAVTAVLAVGAVLAACDGTVRPPDALASVSPTTSELSVRFDVADGRPTTVSVLGFRASTIGSEAIDVLGLVDPLSAAAPDQGCALRDVDETTSALVARGSSVDLEELSDVGVGFEPGGALIRPSPRLYPDAAGVVSGVVAESGPQALAQLPAHLSVYSADTEPPVAALAVPTLPRLVAVNGAAPTAGMRVDATEGLSLSLTDAAGALIELRPFGATVAVRCVVPTNASTESVVSVPRALLVHLPPARPSDWGVPMSIEVARRTHAHAPLAPLHVGVSPVSRDARDARVSIEVRSAVAAEVRP